MMFNSSDFVLTDGIVLGAIILVVGLGFAIDLALILKRGEQATISYRITYWSQRAPILAAALSGFLCLLAGHFWWPNHAWCH